MASILYPLFIVGGDIATTANETQVLVDAVESSVRTKAGERVLRPDYGRTLDPFTSFPNLGAVSQSIRNSTIASTEDYPLGGLTVLSSYGNDGQVTVDIEFNSPEGTGTVQTTL